MAPGWRRYSAALLANAEVVVGAATDPRIDVVDWGCGVRRYKLSMSNEIVHTEDLVAWSSPLLRTALAYRTKLKTRLHA